MNSVAQKAMDEIFKRLSLGYQTKFTAAFDRAGEDAEELIVAWKELWAAELYGLRVSQVRYGIEHVLNAYQDFPPTIGQFRALCLAAGAPATVLLDGPTYPVDQPGYLKFRDFVQRHGLGSSSAMLEREPGQEG